MNIVLVLTTTVNVQNKIFIHQKNPKERIQSYIRAIEQWITLTNFSIIVVENSGYTFPELKKWESDRFKIVSFDESIDAPHLVNNNSKGVSELWSIQYVKKYLINFDFVIKITGRYFIPNFKVNPFGYDAVCQNSGSQSELLGCTISKFDYFFNPCTKCNHIEFLYKHRLQSLNKVLMLPKLPIEPTCMGGIEKILHFL